MRHLADNAFVAVDLLLTLLLLTGKPIGRHAAQTAVFFAYINGRHGSAQVLRAELQDVAPQQVQRQLPQHLFGQLGLAVAQPGLLLQPVGTGLLRRQGRRVALRQIDQIATTDVRQQCADSGNEQQIKGDAPDRGTTHFLVARGAQLLLHVDHVFVLLADLIGQALAFPGPDRPAVVTVGALQFDHRLRVTGPLLLQGLQPVQAVSLDRVVGGQLEQGLEHDLDARLGRFIGFEKLFIAGEQETAHAGFQVDRQLDRLIGVIDHPVRVFDPLDGRQQIGDQRHEENRTDGADAQRQADVATQELTESLLINRRLRGHS
ncbi:hypothetical protein D3C76_368600 [compost metagenome]